MESQNFLSLLCPLGYLYIADTGNDLVRKVNLDSSTASKMSNIIPSSVSIDSSGVAYDIPELAEIEKALGVSISDLSSFSAEEAQALLKSKESEIDPSIFFLAGQMVGRSRPLLAPTDLAVFDAFVYISAAGSRQIWKIEGDTMRPVLGSGLNGRKDIVSNALDSGLWSGGAAGSRTKSLVYNSLDINDFPSADFLDILFDTRRH